MTTTIEDIQYLQQNGDKETYLLLVDSSKRDRGAWPTPSEYEVRFETPFRHVYGIDIINASIPRTQYNIESFNNTFQFYFEPNRPESHLMPTISLEPADYEFNDLLTVLNEKLAQTSPSSTITVSPAFKYDSRTKTRSLKNKFTFTSPYSFVFLSSRLLNTLGFDPEVPEIKSKRTSATTTPLLASTATSTSIVLLPGTKVLQPFPTPTSTFTEIYSIVLECTTFVTNTVIKFRVVKQAGNSFTQIWPDTSGFGYTLKKNTGKESLVIDRKYYDDPIIKNLLELDDAGVKDPSFPVLQATPSSSPYYIEFSTDVTAPSVTIHTKNFPQDALHYVNQGDALPLAVNRLNIDVNAYTYVMDPPFLYDLTGDKYLQIRCKEIEQYMFRTRAYEKFNAGLAKVQLGIFGYENARFDYSSFPPREFHPIGKLGTLTFRFERSDGTLYDFKGIDHTMTLVIRYMTMKNPSFNTQILNPAYNPNLLDYENANLRRAI